MTRIHAEVVLATAVLLVGVLWVLWRTNAPARVQDAGRVVLGVMVVQGLIGYTQFFTHLPPVLVGIHVLGASTVWAAVLWFHYRLSEHLPEEVVGNAGSGRGGGGAERGTVKEVGGRRPDGQRVDGATEPVGKPTPPMEPVESPLREPV